jgi:hypothetical protein
VPTANDEPTFPVLIVKGGSNDGEVLPLQKGGSVLVGSGRLANLKIDSHEVGSAHAKVTWDESGIYITDNGSVTGTFVNGLQIEMAPVWDGDRITFLPPDAKSKAPHVIARVPPGFVEEPVPPPPEEAPKPTAPAPRAPGASLGRAVTRAGAPGPSTGVRRPVSRGRRRGPALPFEPRLLAIGGGGAVVLLVALVVLLRFCFSGSPALATVSPSQSVAGQTATLAGKGFGAIEEPRTVRFGDLVARIVSATEDTLQVQVPEPPGGSALDVQITVETSRGKSRGVPFKILASPVVRSLAPGVALPGDEVVARGQALQTELLTVTVDGKPAKVIEATPDQLRFRVPPEVPPDIGRKVAVIFRSGGMSSKPIDLVLGRLPLVTTVSPAAGQPGDKITIAGYGFGADVASNSVTIAGLPALVLKAAPNALEAIVPALPGSGEAEVVVRCPAGTSSGQPPVKISHPSAAAFILRFVAAPASTETGSQQAVVTTDAGPVLLLSSADGAMSVGERAFRVAAALNAVAEEMRDGRPVTLEARERPEPGVAVAGSQQLLLRATAEDAAGCEAPPGLKAKGRRPTPAALASFWTGVLSDYLALFVRQERPIRLYALSPRARTLAALQSEVGWRAGVPTSFGAIRALSPATLEKLRELTLLVPAEGQGIAGASVEGRWDGEVVEGDLGAKPIVVQFTAQGSRVTGTLTSSARGISVNVALKDVSVQKSSVSFTWPAGASPRYFVGELVGSAITGTVHAAKPPAGPVGTFSLKYMQ